MCGVTQMDSLKTEHIRGTVKVGQASRKVQEARLRWYGHILRCAEDYLRHRIVEMRVPARQKRGKARIEIEGLCGRGLGRKELGQRYGIRQKRVK